MKGTGKFAVFFVSSVLLAKLAATALHELGHVAAMWMTGGSIAVIGILLTLGAAFFSRIIQTRIRWIRNMKTAQIEWKHALVVTGVAVTAVVGELLFF